MKPLIRMPAFPVTPLRIQFVLKLMFLKQSDTNCLA